MERNTAHNQKQEPILEYILYYLRFRKIKNFIPYNSDILDLGCGYNGNFLNRINEKINSGIGIDLYVNKEINIKNVDLLEGDLNKRLSLNNNKFDIITSIALIEHLIESENHLEECYRLLKKGGMLLLTTPAPKSQKILEFLAEIGFLSQTEIKDHKRYFNNYELKNLAEKAGFSYVDCNKFQFGFNNLLIAKK